MMNVWSPDIWSMDILVTGIFGDVMIFGDRIFGHGTLSGDLLPHPSFAQPPINQSEHYTYHSIDKRYMRTMVTTTMTLMVTI